MTPIIRPSSDLRKNYNSIAEICRTKRQPVFLTRNGRGDMVIQDIETYRQREEDFAQAQRLFAAEQKRGDPSKWCTIDEFFAEIDMAIEEGAAHGNE